MVLRDLGQNSLFHDLFQIWVLKLHNKKYIIEPEDRFFFGRYNYIVEFWDEAAVTEGRYFMDLSHNLDLSDEFDTVIIMLSESFDMLDGHNLFGF